MSGPIVTALALEGADGQFVDLLLDGRRHVETIDGLVGLTARERVRPRPGRRGVINTSRYLDSDPIVIKGQLFGDDPADAWTEYNAVAAACASAIDTDRHLRWSGGGILDLVETRVRVSSLTPPLVVAQDVIAYQLILRPGDPASYSQNESAVDGSTLSMAGGGKEYPYTYPRGYVPAGGAVANFTVGGTTKTPPVIEIYGQVSSPVVKLVSTGEEIRINGSVAAGTYLEVDVDAREVRLADGTVRNNLYDFQASTWFEMPPGPQSVQLLAGSFDANAHARVRWRDAYA